MGLLEGRVAVVTGAGGGLGRAYAQLFAAEGAAVVVNDLGGSRDGSGSSATMADTVAKEITDKGGKAVANHANVTAPEQVQAMVEQAIKAFGRLDILVNNAGILRDKTLLKMTDEHWDLVMAVHAKGAYLCAKAAAAKMKALGNGGRIVNTTSYAGLKGNFGQANYGAAKAAIWGFSLTAAQELARIGITVNCVAPMAKTRMTDDIAMIPDEFRPEDVAPMALYLASDDAADVTGRTFGVHGKQIFEYLMEITDGVTKDDGEWTPAEIHARLAEIGRTSADKAITRAEEQKTAGKTDQEAVFESLYEAFLPEKAGDWKANIYFDIKGGVSYTLDIEKGTCKVMEGKAEGITCTVAMDVDTILGMLLGKVDANRAFMAGKAKADNLADMAKFAKAFDLAAYAKRAEEILAAKSSSEAPNAPEPPAPQAEAPEATDLTPTGMNRAALGTTYEDEAIFAKPAHIEAFATATNDHSAIYQQDSGERQLVPPVFSVAPLHDIMFKAILDENLGMDVLRMVHGEQEFLYHRPLRPWDLINPRAEITGIEEKSSGDLCHVKMRAMVNGQCAVEATASFFVRGKEKAAPTEKAPAETAQPIEYTLLSEATVAPDQTKRYAAASGDDNPIHIDPETAKAAGLPDVILQGLCTLSFASNGIVEKLCGGNPERLARVRARFSKYVLPRDTVTTRSWQTDEQDGVTVHAFEAVNQRGEVVLSNGEATIAPLGPVMPSGAPLGPVMASGSHSRWS